MSKKVTGVFESESEVIKAINRLTHDNYTMDEILVIADRNKKTSLIEAQTDVKVEKEPAVQKEEGSFWKKLKSGFSQKESSSNESSDFKERFKELGLSEEEAKKHNDFVTDRKIILMAADKSFNQNDKDSTLETSAPS
ncbi:general stress protein [Alkalicoccus daliensis]|uniref:Heat induced stress protein YflT n=1 Tax=Alkalicoccus daliensis TaxID=745820 RepID=A0A1G9ZEA3_9BACI|nr:general stress protein [Alkalicoccus daliensis]SDN19554.1 Heat induced stress protein YflT [Alkalicoccus daliensis]